MATNGPSEKRKASDEPISPPPLKRKVQSTTTKTAMQNFFTPTSQKPRDRTVWTERAPSDDVPGSLLVGRYEPEATQDGALARRKIAAFDLDSTLITTSSGKKHGNVASDWKWWHHTVPTKLREMYNEQGYRVVILSNQAGLTLHFDAKFKGPKAASQNRVAEFKQKCSAVVTNLDLPITVYAATERDAYRKPRTGMWKEVCEDYDIPLDEVDLANSIFVGDAGGRIASVSKTTGGIAAVAKDFSCSDRNFAQNVGIGYQTPEEFFLGEKPRDFARDFDLEKYPYLETQESAAGIKFDQTNNQDIVLFVGSPGAGKSTFYWTILKPLGYERINQDILKTREKCIQTAKELLKGGGSIAIDNTNASPETRAIWVDVANQFKVPIRCVWFKTPQHICEHNDAARSQNKTLNPEDRSGLPRVAFTDFQKRYKEPRTTEGFQDITPIEFSFRGSKGEHGVWARYWI